MLNRCKAIWYSSGCKARFPMGHHKNLNAWQSVGIAQTWWNIASISDMNATKCFQIALSHLGGNLWNVPVIVGHLVKSHDSWLSNRIQHTFFQAFGGEPHICFVIWSWEWSTKSPFFPDLRGYDAHFIICKRCEDAEWVNPPKINAIANSIKCLSFDDKTWFSWGSLREWS